jgi:hypothetical protein
VSHAPGAHAAATASAAVTTGQTSVAMHQHGVVSPGGEAPPSDPTDTASQAPGHQQQRGVAQHPTEYQVLPGQQEEQLQASGGCQQEGTAERQSGATPAHHLEDTTQP